MGGTPQVTPRRAGTQQGGPPRRDAPIRVSTLSREGTASSRDGSARSAGSLLPLFETGQGGGAAPYGDYTGPVFSLMLETGADPAPYRREFPSDDMTTFVYLSEARMGDMTVMFMPESGVIDVTALEISNGRVRAAGTFSGQLGNPGGEGSFVEVRNGRFSVRGVPHRDEISGG